MNTKRLYLASFLLILISLFISNFSYAQTTNSVEYTEDWKVYKEFDGVKVEYKFTKCDNQDVKNQVLVLFKFTNTTAEKKELSWITKIWRNGDCYNCSTINNPEYAHEVVLSPNEVIEAPENSKSNKALYIFSHFIKRVPGMSASKLTNFEFTNVEVITQ